MAIRRFKANANDPKLMENKKKNEQEKPSHRQLQKRKILYAIVSIVIASIVIVGILIPTVVIKKNGTQPSPTTTSSSTMTTTSNMTMTTTEIDMCMILLTAVQRKVYGVHNTFVGGDSTRATPGSKRGQYSPEDSPDKACDGNVSTKYINYGSCEKMIFSDSCGLNTGFYLELARGSTLINGLKICLTGLSCPCGPTVVSLEGSNMTGTDLTLGSSWTLLYHGTSGLSDDPGRQKCGSLQHFNNTIAYTSYRFLVLAKNAGEVLVEYSEVQLYSF
ncbi:unnamed protein product [Adineta ricciae]|uniref:Uncharacterized protein n=1 Tax=Adineta ricciae TaxID=249248 RepID=A0A814H9B2_ADIRI|nr:unnamed protein product [Adineta ricciae]